jgi:hemolysin activation/secretion protein
VDGGKLVQMAARITERYRKDGYLLSYATVPPQDVQAGMVRFSVVEGRVGTILINGEGIDRPALEAIAKPLLKDAPLQSSTLERVIGLIRDYPGVQITDIALSRTDAEAGIYALKITLKNNRARAFTYIDNRGTQSVGRVRIYSSFSLSSVAVAGDEVRADLFAMPGRHFQYLYGRVLTGVPIGRDGMRLTLSASKGNQNLRDLVALNGDSTSVTAQLSYPVLRSRALSILGKLSLNDWSSSATEHGLPRLRDRLRVAKIGVEWSTETSTRVQGELSLSQGLGFAGMTRAGDPLASRPGAGGRFSKAEFTLQVIRPLSDDFRLQAVMAGQYSDRALLSSEEFALGGNRIGRAFEFNAVTGPRGIGGGLELSYRLGDSKGTIANPWLFAFADGGKAFDATGSAPSNRPRSLVSAGVGSRLSIGGSAISGEIGKPLGGPGGHGLRVFFSAYRPF